MSPPSPVPLFDRRLLFVTGKGGVGKSTVSAALGRSLAAQGRRVLLATCCVKERLSAHFGVAPLDRNIRQIGDNVWGVHIRAEAAMSEYGGMVLKNRALFDAVFGSQLVRSFLAGVPGLYEWAVLGKVWFHSTEKRADGAPRFHTVVYDAPATGHALDMLRVPKVIVDLVPPGLLRRDAALAWDMLSDPQHTGIVLVSLPEDLPTTEALELLETLETELRLPVARLVVNGVMEELFTAEERQTLCTLGPLDPITPGDEGVAAAVRRAIRERVQAENLARLAGLTLPQSQLPLLPELATTPGAAEHLAQYLNERAQWSSPSTIA